jgi:hypothetical protein
MIYDLPGGAIISNRFDRGGGRQGRLRCESGRVLIMAHLMVATFGIELPKSRCLSSALDSGDGNDLAAAIQTVGSV